MRKNYFFITSIFMLVLSIIAFSDNLFFDIHQKSNSDPKFIIHGLFCLAWFVILVIQTGFARQLKYKAHIRLGLAGMLVALGVFISSVYIFIVIYKGWDAMLFFVKANRFFMLSFGILITLGYVKRKRPIIHKRAIYIATLYMLGPILDRVAGKFNIDNVEMFNGIIWNVLFISLLIYDQITLKKLHWLSIAGFVWFYLVWVISIYS